MSTRQLLKSISPKSKSKLKPQTLTAKEEFKLGTIIQDPKTSAAARQKAIDTLVLKNIFLVLKMSPKYNRKEFEFDDIVGYGIIGLFTAARKYNPDRKLRFATYARHWIKESIMKAVRDYSGAPKIPVFLVKDLWRITRALACKEIYTEAEVDTFTNLTAYVQKNNNGVDVEVKFKDLIFNVVQFDPEYTLTEDPVTPEEVFRTNEQKQILMDKLHELLTDEEFEVVAYAFGLEGRVQMSLSQLHESLGIQNVRKLKISAFEKLRQCDILKTLCKELES